MAGEIQLPGATDRTAVVGRTGSGKTLAALFLLANADFDVRPWVVVDYKNDEAINMIERAELIRYSDGVPDEPGIYILKVLPGDSDEGALSDWFRQAWEHEDVGLYIDEGYMINPRDKWFNACLTQGRSKSISMIVLSQRPVWMSRFVFSEADYLMIFELTHDKDREKVREYVRDDKGLLEAGAPQFHSFYYDVANKELRGLKPVPKREVILGEIERRLAAMQEPVAGTPQGAGLRRAI